MSGNLELREVRIRLDGRLLVAADVTIAPGQTFTVMGPSGSGKSTLLAFVAGFLDPVFQASGRVLLDGSEITHVAPEIRHTGLLFQDPLLFPHLSVAGNLMFGMPPGRIRRRERAAEALETIGLGGFEARDPATLSGGQKARVALLRLLLSEPRAALLDEPFSKLDTSLRAEMRTLVFDRLRSAGLPAILVTHDEADAEAAAGPVLMLE